MARTGSLAAEWIAELKNRPPPGHRHIVPLPAPPRLGLERPQYRSTALDD